MSLISPYVDATATLLVGLWAAHLGWRHPALSGPPHEEHAEFRRVERCIGPLLIAIAILELAVTLA
jgi:hypothetical protein